MNPQHSQAQAYSIYTLIIFLTQILYIWSITADTDLLKMVSPKYCSTLEIIFVHYNQDFENFTQELCFIITKCKLYGFSFYRSIRFDQTPENLNPAKKSIGTPKFCHVISQSSS